MNKYLVFMGIGFELIGLIMAGAYVGKYLFESDGLTVALILLALVGWLIHIVYLFRRVK